MCLYLVVAALAVTPCAFLDSGCGYFPNRVFGKQPSSSFSWTIVRGSYLSTATVADDVLDLEESNLQCLAIASAFAQFFD